MRMARHGMSGFSTVGLDQEDAPEHEVGLALLADRATTHRENYVPLHHVPLHHPLHVISPKMAR